MTTRAENKDLEVSLLERYCSGTVSAEEAAQIEVWFSEHTGLRIWYEQFRVRLRKGSFSLLSAKEHKTEWLRLIQRRPEIEAGLLSAQQSDRDAVILARRVYPESTARRSAWGTQPLRRGVWSILAGATLAILTIMVGWHVGARHRGAHMDMPVSAYVTSNGERANITLPDGNTVALDVASRLEVPADYLAGDHTLRLSGEALFTVQHHSGTPITVLTGQTTTRVLGTSFVMRHYETDSVTTVAVREGKVAVDAVVVTANRLIEVRRNGATVVRPATPSQFSFVMGTLTLDVMSILKAIPELDRWYDVDIRLGDPVLATRDLGGRFAAGSRVDLSTNLEMTLNVHVVRNGRVLTLFPRR